MRKRKTNGGSHYCGFGEYRRVLYTLCTYIYACACVHTIYCDRLAHSVAKGVSASIPASSPCYTYVYNMRAELNAPRTMCLRAVAARQLAKEILYSRVYCLPATCICTYAYGKPNTNAVSVNSLLRSSAIVVRARRTSG